MINSNFSVKLNKFHTLFHLVMILVVSRVFPISQGYRGQIRVLHNTFPWRTVSGGLRMRGGLSSTIDSNNSNSSIVVNRQKKEVIATSSPLSSSLQQVPPTRRTQRNTGGLRRLPIVKRSTEIITQAKRVGFRIQPDTAMKNTRNRVRKQGAERLNAVTLALCVPLRDVIQGYRRELRLLHPFERVVADLTVRARKQKDGLTLQDVLDDLNEARKEILIVGKEWIAKAKTADTARESAEIMAEGEERICEAFDELAAKPLDDLIEFQKSLRGIPAVKLDTPAVVLVGCPNVGKSSIVRAVSSGTPEVNNYPFTTRGMTLGHVEVFWDNNGNAKDYVITPSGDSVNTNPSMSYDDDTLVKGGYAFSQLCQVMDSPGLLARDDAERNEMEQLTLAAMKHLPTAVMYVLDFSGQAGDKCSSVEDQLLLRKEIRSRFPRRPWIDVVSKVDLGIVDGAIEKLEAILAEENESRQATYASNDHEGRTNYIQLSILQGTGLSELRDAVMNMLGDVKIVVDAMSVLNQQQKQ